MHDLPFPAPLRPGQAHLRILATSDLHVHILPFDYYADRATGTLGLARLADRVAALRRAAPNTVLFDNGDFLQGNPLGDLCARRGLAKGEVHPMVAAMNALGYDAGNLGNHEFSHGLAFLRRAVADLAFPLVSANVETVAGTPLTRPWVLLDRDLRDGEGRRRPLRLGVIGFLPGQTAVWEAEHLAGRLRTPPIAAAADRHLPDLRAAGAEIVVALCHAGIGQAGEEEGEAAAAILAARGDIDAVVAGHTHRVFPGPAHDRLPGVDARRGLVAGRPAVMPGARGSHLGVIDLLLEPRSGGGWRVADSVGTAVAADSAAAPGRVVLASAGRRVRRAALPAHRATRQELSARLGRTEVPLDTHFAMAGDCGAGLLLAVAKRDAVRAALAGTAAGRLPLLATTAVFRAGGHGGPENFFGLGPGPLTRRHLAALCPFPNRLAALRLPVAVLSAWLEDATAAFRTLHPGLPDQPLVDPAVPPYRTFGLLGASYALDLARPPGGGRVRDLRIAGRPADPRADVVVATDSHRASLLLSARPQAGIRRLPLSADADCREMVADWIRQQGVVAALPASGWRLLLPPGATATVDTSPEADPERAGLPGLHAEAIGPTPDGFLRVRLSPAADGGQARAEGA